MTCCIVPTLRYRDAPAAIEWLCRAFGFERHLVVTDDDGVVEHAQLTFDGAMIMLGSVRQSPFDAVQTTPATVGGWVTQSPYVIVSSIDAHHARAIAAGAEIVLPLAAQDYGGKHYACRDPEGHLWNFGSYDPWADPAV
ncbi:MAG: VOC family protein [Rhodocyclaceae bacterium]|nr:VOC family protein [Rhodocyclaceae bacterium]